MKTPNRIHAAAARARRLRLSERRVGFTLIELIVVIVIIGVLLSIAVPAFSSMLRSGEAGMAETLLRSAMRSGRAAAMQSGGREDAAVLFTYEPNGRLTMLTCVKVGELLDKSPSSGTAAPATREIFVPLESAEPAQLPRNWMVRGYAAQNMTDTQWYEQVAGSPNRYPGGNQGDWVFPENAFFRRDVVGNGANRQSFIVRFEGGTGLLSTANAEPALVFLAGIDASARTGTPWTAYSSRIGQPRKYVERVLADRTLTITQQRALLGDESGDTILVKPVKALALYDERKLAGGIDVRIDAKTGSIYSSAGTPEAPRFVNGATGAKIRSWLEGTGDLNGNGQVDSREQGYLHESKLFLVDRYTSELRELGVQP